MRATLALALLASLPLLLLTRPARAADAAPKIKVLIIDGFSNHDWRLTTQLLRGILQPTNLFDITVSTSPPTTLSPGWDAWRPRFSDYDVILQNSNDINGGPSWPAEVQQSFTDFIKSGGGVLAFHSANNAFPKWPDYNQIIGIGWRNKLAGTALTIDTTDPTHEKIIRIPPGTGLSTGHGPRNDVLVHIIGDHPIHAGLPRTWLTPGLEVYYYARGPAENIQVLSYGFDPKTKINWPLEWTVTYGNGRMYSSTFGHVWKGDTQPASMRCADEQTLLMRALQWLAKRPITVPVPADFPTATAVSVRGEIPIAP